MKQVSNQEKNLLESREALNLYLENLFYEEEVQEPESELPEKIQPTELKVLMIEVGKHTLALPVDDLKGVVDIDHSTVVTLPEQEPYSLGMISYQDNKIALFDINWIFNNEGKLIPPSEKTDIRNVHNAIVFDAGQMAIACEHVSQICTVKTDQINWSKSKQRWLDGIIIEQMVTLLNLREVKRLFLRGYSGKEHSK